MIGALFFLKTVSTFPLIFWPLYREVDVLLMHEESPALKMKLPWAIRRQQNMKLFIKVILVVAILAPALLLDQDSFQYMAAACVAIAVNFAQFVFPASALALAVRRHVELLERRKLGEENSAAVDRVGGVTYIFGSLKVHYVTVHA